MALGSVYSIISLVNSTFSILSTKVDDHCGQIQISVVTETERFIVSAYVLWKAKSRVSSVLEQGRSAVVGLEKKNRSSLERNALALTDSCSHHSNINRVGVDAAVVVCITRKRSTNKD